MICLRSNLREVKQFRILIVKCATRCIIYLLLYIIPYMKLSFKSKERGNFLKFPPWFRRSSEEWVSNMLVKGVVSSNNFELHPCNLRTYFHGAGAWDVHTRQNYFHVGYIRAYPIWAAANIPIGQLVGCAENNGDQPRKISMYRSCQLNDSSAHGSIS